MQKGAAFTAPFERKSQKQEQARGRMPQIASIIRIWAAPSLRFMLHPHRSFTRDPTLFTAGNPLHSIYNHFRSFIFN